MAHVVGIGNDFGTDETAFKVGMDDTGGLGSFPALVDGPGAHFVGTGGEVAAQAQRVVAGADDAHQTAFRDAVGGKHLCLFPGGKALQLFFQLGADAGETGMAFFGQLLHAGHKVVAVGHGGFVHVGAVDDGLGGQQAQFTPGLEEGLVVGQLERAGAVTGIEVLQQALHDLCGGLGVLAALGHLLQLFQAAFHALQVGQQQFGLDGVDVAQGVHAAVHMSDVLILEAADNFYDGGAFADIAQELVAQAFALAGAAHQAGDVDEVHTGVDGLFGRDLGRKRVHALVGHGHGGLVGFDGTERIVGGLRVLRLGQGVEQGGFPHVGQTHNADAEGHGLSLRAWKFRAMRRWRRRKKAQERPEHVVGMGSL